MLTPKHILPRSEYGQVREELRPTVLRERARRRIELGPYMSLLFESRATVLAHIHEILWIEGRSSRAEIEREIEEYACLVPSPRRLTATLTIHTGSSAIGGLLSEELARGRGPISLDFGELHHVCELMRPDDPLPAAVHYLGFNVLPWTLRQLLDPRREVFVRVASVIGEHRVVMPQLMRAALANALSEHPLVPQRPMLGKPLHRPRPAG